MKGKEKNMTEIRNIIHRLRMGHSIRRIHRDLGTHRPIIRELLALAVTQQWLDPEFPLPNDEEISKHWNKKVKNQLHPLDAYKEQLKQWDSEGISSVVIQRLLKDKCTCDVQAIRRYRSKHFQKPVEPIMVRTTVPGRDLEVDFGELGKFINDDQKTQKAWLFSLRLRHSRRTYREIVLNQTLSTFLMGHVHAFEYFNGVTKNAILDNLKAGVTRSTIDNDMINRSYQDLAEHYGFVISPCLPYTPQHKGGVEGDVKYVKRNFLPYFLARQKEVGIPIPRLCDLKTELVKWNEEVADIHIIQGIGRSPLEIFKAEEEKSLSSLPKTRWEPTTWSVSIVRKDWRVMVDSAYYSVPCQLIGKTVEICLTHSIVRIFCESKEVAFHERASKKWEYKRRSEHAPPFQEEVLQCSREGLFTLAEEIGSFTHQMAKAILSHPSVDKLKPVRYMLRLADKYSKVRLERACERAFNCRLFSFGSVKNILEKGLDSQEIETSSRDKVIPMPRFRFARDLTDYKSENGDFRKETFEEKIERHHPYSRHGNAMLGAYQAQIADQILDEEKQFQFDKKSK